MPAAIETLVPHRAPMCWLDALTDCRDATATATACFAAGHFAVADGAVLETSLVECVAQTVAAALGHRATTSEPSVRVSGGMLAAVHGFRIEVRPLAGKTLRIEIRELKRLGLMLRVAGVVSCEGQVVASGELSLYA